MKLLVIPFSILLSAAVILVAAHFLPLNWGSVTFSPAKTVTVTGTSREQQQNNEASFSVSVSENSDDRDEAVNQVNEVINGIVENVKAFGVADADIRTEGISINRIDDIYRPEVSGTWNVSNNITVTLRDATRVNELATLLSSSGATSVYGPNFRVSEEDRSDEELLKSAIEDARTKAEAIAVGSGVELGKVISVDETFSGGGVVYPAMMDRAMSGGGGMAIEPGTTTISKSVQVTFELR